MITKQSMLDILKLNKYLLNFERRCTFNNVIIIFHDNDNIQSMIKDVELWINNLESDVLTTECVRQNFIACVSNTCRREMLTEWIECPQCVGSGVERDLEKEHPEIVCMKCNGVGKITTQVF